MTVTTQETAAQLKHLYTYLETNKDTSQAEKVLDLIDKLQRKEIMIGFAGHFSAGKSSLINTLVQEEILPSSPIPTSANVVKLRSGAPFTVTSFPEARPRKYEGDLELEQVKDLCREGETITGVEISRPIKSLPENTVLLDTPGVDSTNDADRLITESSLHMMDYMFYVMDYNHVQSEVNLKFLLEMQQRRTPFSIVINQIDKHNREELTFTEFKESVRHSLSDWGINPHHIYYTSLKNYEIDTNELDRLMQDFRALFNRTEEQIENQALSNARTIAEETKADKEEEKEDKKQLLEEELEKSEEITATRSTVKDWNLYFEELDKEEDELYDRFKERVLSFFPNAYLMPSSIRDNARDYLEAMQPDFKVGMLFTKKKTEEERQNREEAFYQSLTDGIEKNLKWPLRDRIMEVIDTFGIEDQQLRNKIQEFNISYPKERLASLIESGAKVTGNYVLRYTEEVAKDVKQLYRAHVLEWLKDMKAFLEKKRELEREKHHDVITALEKKQMIEGKIEKLEENYAEETARLMQQLHKEEVSDQVRAAAEQALQEREQNIKVYSASDVDLPVKSSSRTAAINENWEKTEPKELRRVSFVLSETERALQVLERSSGMEDLFHQLNSKRKRLSTRNFTVALFGAFSAGKSSFANALLGSKVLPVSPNPTTATINKIVPPTEEYPDRTVKVKVKTTRQLLEDMQEALNQLEISGLSLSEVKKQLDQLHEEEFMKLEQKQLAFIKAFQAGFSFMEGKLGEELTVEWEAFSSYVADEEKSCFIESLELYYDCAWTKAGITLVDTPGADSVNARHTDVSFDYIKNADAILFVTYYNHPFSKADQSFLHQLGRVKDTFAMDKMFFIINASDLASSDKELGEVESYVQEQLVHFNIRWPRLFSLSSLHGLRKKLEGTSHEPMALFEEKFHQFLSDELAEVMIQSINQDLHTAKETLREFIQQAEMDQEERDRQLKMFQKEKGEASDTLHVRLQQAETEPILHKLEKQIHFVHERMMLNFHDVFKHHFNPAVINGREESVKNQLHKAADHLIHEMNHEMKQELQAVSLRIERLIRDMAAEKKQVLEKNLQQIRTVLLLSTPELDQLASPELSLEFTMKPKEYEDILKGFKSTKAFFEKNEKEIMKDSLSARISPLLQQQLQSGEEILKQHYTALWEEQFSQLKKVWEEEINHTYERFIYGLKHPVDKGDLEMRYKELADIKF
ncbi:dynamin family protein [Halobacillus salinarum]|uniref:Dynamin family protein n=1 Tax=Halobacillus salinarum TaxID=2932257 RepID=A0ABY4EF61_9BACI|nr:dynamin family protein [Halobacillus salinarum]UOQ42796.1 dynamin family protein [Halobacillus salinarum]